jgi:hypothetical protein
MVSLFPSEDVPKSSDSLSYISLVHPRTNELSKFLLNESTCKLFEIQLVDRGSVSNGSFLIQSAPSRLVQSKDLRIFTRADPILILLGQLTMAAPESSSFIDYMDVMNVMVERAPDQASMAKVLQVLNSPTNNFRDQLLQNVFESKSVLDRCLVRIHPEKLLAYLRLRLEVAAKAIGADNALVECQGNLANVQIVALELVRSYLPPEWYERLVAAVGFNTQGLYVEEQIRGDTGGVQKTEKSGDVKKRPNQNTETQTAKKAREIAKSCMKMTSFFKPKDC